MCVCGCSLCGVNSVCMYMCIEFGCGLYAQLGVWKEVVCVRNAVIMKLYMDGSRLHVHVYMSSMIL